MKRTWIPLLIITLWVMPVKAEMLMYADFSRTLSPLGHKDPCAMALYFDYTQVRNAVPRLRTYFPYPWEPGGGRSEIQSPYQRKVAAWFRSSVLWLMTTTQTTVVIGGRNVTPREQVILYKQGGNPANVTADPRSLRILRDKSVREFRKIYDKDKTADNQFYICNATAALITVLQQDKFWWEADENSSTSIFDNPYDVVGFRIPFKRKSECGCFLNYEDPDKISDPIRIQEWLPWQPGVAYMIPVVDENIFGVQFTQAMWPHGRPTQR
jgi:hypothetical protein